MKSLQSLRKKYISIFSCNMIMITTNCVCFPVFFFKSKTFIMFIRLDLKNYPFAFIRPILFKPTNSKSFFPSLSIQTNFYRSIGWVGLKNSRKHENVTASQNIFFRLINRTFHLIVCLNLSHDYVQRRIQNLSNF